MKLVENVRATHALRVGGATGFDARIENGAKEGFFDEKMDDL